MPDDENSTAENSTHENENADDDTAANGAPPPSGPDAHAPAVSEAEVARIVAKVMRRLAPAITGIGVLLLCLELLIGTAPEPWRTGLIIASILLAAGSWLLNVLRDGEGRRGSLIAVLVGFSVFFLALGYLLRPVVDYTRLVDCDDPVELSVLVPVDGAAGLQEMIAVFNERHVDRNRCRVANVTAYSAPWPDVERAMALGWGSDEDGDGSFAPLRDVGPRPHLWIAESQTQVDLAAGELDGSDVEYEVFAPDDAEPIGRTPLVLAVPDTVLDGGFNDGSQRAGDRSLADLITELDDEYGTPVLRSDPAVTYTGMMFIRALYGLGDDPGGVGARLENQLADAAAETGIALSPSETDLLCNLSLAQGANPAAAVLTTEAALARYNVGAALGDECALAGSARSGLVPIYDAELGALDYQAVGFDWNDDAWAGKRALVAEELRRWLAGEDGRWNPTDMGVRDVDYEGAAINGEVRFDKDFSAEADPISAGEFEKLQEVYSENRVPTDVLLAIDRSETMNASGGGASRFELATEGVSAALEYLGADDRVGLWTFPADGSASHTEVLAMSPDPGENAAGLLADTEVSQGVDLHQTVVDGIAELEAVHEGERLGAMVVLTDGADPDTSSTTVEEVHARLAGSQATLYLIAVGEASCRSASFDALGANPRVTCLEAEEEQITATFDRLFNQLWSGNG